MLEGSLNHFQVSGDCLDHPPSGDGGYLVTGDGHLDDLLKIRDGQWSGSRKKNLAIIKK